jgi:hypothetical protein
MESLGNTPSLERRAIALVAVLTLTPVFVCGLWTPLAHGFDLTAAASAPALIVGGSIVALVAVLGLRLERTRVSLGLVAVVAAVVAAAAADGAARFVLAALVLAVGCAGRFAYGRLVEEVPSSFDGRARAHKVLAALWTVTALAAVVQTTRLSVFMTDATRVEASMIPGSEFMERHSCLSAYVHGAKMAADGEDNVYAFLYREGDDPLRAPLPSGAEYLGSFTLDPYGYPPPFLLLPRMLVQATGNYAVLRALWFLLSALTAAIGMVAIAHWLGGRARHQFVKLAPLVWASMPLLLTLQLGNFQLACVMISVLAMIAFDKERNKLGGLLLAFAALSKFAPGLLGIVLLAQRRYKAAAWTTASGVALVVVSLVVLGPEPWTAFLTYHLPRVQSGEALGFLDDNASAIANNLSVFGIPFKLSFLGAADMGWEVARLLGNGYSLILVAAAWWVGKKRGDRAFQLCAWLAVITLGALRSPFAPGHVLVGALLCLPVLAHEIRHRGHVVALVLTWVAFSVLPPLPDPTMLVVVSLLRQIALFGVLGWLIVRRVPEAASGER